MTWGNALEALTVLVALVVALGFMWGCGGGGVGKNPPLSDNAKASMRRFLDEQNRRG
jgi:hypothetical protein